MDVVKVLIITFITTFLVMSVSPQPTEGITSGSLLPAFLVNLGSAFAEFFLQLTRKLDFGSLTNQVTATLNNSAIMKICGNGESEEQNFESFGVNCSSEFHQHFY